jgi:hypothetical protein
MILQVPREADSPNPNDTIHENIPNSEHVVTTGRKDKILPNGNKKSFKRETINISEKKFRNLIGCDGSNIRLIQHMFGLCIYASHPEIVSNELDDDTNNLFSVKLRSTMTLGDFSDAEWRANVFRYVRSATRGGFLKKFTNEEYRKILHRKGGQLFNQEHLDILESKWNVEVKIIPFENLHYICVVEQISTLRRNDAKLLHAIAILGEWIHSRYRNEHNSVPLQMTFQSRRTIPDSNKITRREDKRRERKNANKWSL